MASASLSATVRADTGKGVARKLRSAGQVPAVIYGHSREAQSLAVPQRELGRLLDRIAAASTVIELTIDGRLSRTLIREIQRHPVKRNILHVDFQELVAGEMISVACPIVYVGVPIGVRASGGVLDQIMHELQIEVDPANLPNHIDIDVSGLDLGNSLHVADLKVPEGVRLTDDPTATVCVVSMPKVSTADAEADAAAAAAAAEPEVIRAKKVDEAK
jgi:large subunit ribosomal protein L25